MTILCFMQGDFLLVFRKEQSIDFSLVIFHGTTKSCRFFGPWEKGPSCLVQKKKAVLRRSPVQFLQFPLYSQWPLSPTGPGTETVEKLTCLYTQFGSSLEERIGEGVRERDEGLVGRSAGRCECEPAAVRSQSAD